MTGEVGRLSVADLLRLHADIADELRSRGVARSANNPTGDLAEYLFCKAFGWTQAPNSERSIDATGADGTRYQIKGRRLTEHNTSRQLSAIRDLKGANFDMLAGVLLDKYYGVIKAALIPRDVIVKRATYREHTNSHKFMLTDSVWDVSGVIDVTPKLRSIKL